MHLYFSEKKTDCQAKRCFSLFFYNLSILPSKAVYFIIFEKSRRRHQRKQKAFAAEANAFLKNRF